MKLVLLMLLLLGGYASLPQQSWAQPLPPCHVNSQCGIWQGNYTQLHWGMSKGVVPMRRLVSVPVNSGFADRMIGSITAMLFALLTNRAIYFELLTANGGAGSKLRPLTDVFAMDTIDWSDFKAPMEVMTFLNSVSPTNEDADALKEHSFGSINGSKSEYYISMVNGWGAEHLYSTVMEESDSYETVYMVLNRGMTVSVFDDPAIKARVQGLGLQPRLTFGCLYKYLFRPNADVFARFPSEISALSDIFALKIGVQIRTGDLANLNATNRTDIELFRSFFDCAQEIEDTRRRPGQRIMWYFLSDSLSLRKAVKAKFGGKVLVKTIGVDTSHSAKETTRQGQGAVSLATYHSIAGEHWLFSMTDFQVVSFDSGIGRSAAFLGQHSIDTIYTINKWWDSDPPGYGQARKCGIEDADDYKGVAATWSLI